MEGRQRRRHVYLQDYVTIYYLTSDEDELHVVETINQDPIRYEDAVKEMKWRIVMDRETEIIEKDQTWSLVDLAMGAKCIGVKWVYKTKLNEKRS